MRRLIVLLAACGVDRDIDSDVSLTQGLYGQLSSGSDLGDERALAGLHVGAFRGDTGILVAVAMTDGDGVYALDVMPQTVDLCVLDGDACDPVPHTLTCCAIEIVGDGAQRQDWVMNQEGGSWCDGRCSD